MKKTTKTQVINSGSGSSVSSNKESKSNLNLKRPQSASLIAPPSKSKNRRSSVDKLSNSKGSSKSETTDLYDDEEDLDIKPKKKQNRHSMSTTDDLISITSLRNNMGSKRKNSVSGKTSVSTDLNDDSENDKDNLSQDGTVDNSNNDNNTDLESTENEFKCNLTINDLDVNKFVDVKYGNGNNKQYYRAKIVQLNMENQTILVHYLGWNNRYDEWIKMDRIYRMQNDNYNGHRRRKTSKQTSVSNNGHSNSSTNDPSSSPSQHQNNENHQANKDSKAKLSLSSSSSSSMSNNSESNEQKHQNSSKLNPQKLTKRSLSSSTSSTSSSDQHSSSAQEDVNLNDSLTNNKPSKAIPSSKPVQSTSKTRNCDSISSNSSTLVRESSEEISTKTNLTEETEIEIKVKPIELDPKTEIQKPETKVANDTNDDSTSDTASTSSVDINNLNSLLSIKEEVIEFDTCVPVNTTTPATQTKPEPSEAASLVVNDLLIDILDSTIEIAESKIISIKPDIQSIPQSQPDLETNKTETDKVDKKIKMQEPVKDNDNTIKKSQNKNTTLGNKTNTGKTNSKISMKSPSKRDLCSINADEKESKPVIEQSSKKARLTQVDSQTIVSSVPAVATVVKCETPAVELKNPVKPELSNQQKITSEPISDIDEESKENNSSISTIKSLVTNSKKEQHLNESTCSNTNNINNDEKQSGILVSSVSSLSYVSSSNVPVNVNSKTVNNNTNSNNNGNSSSNSNQSEFKYPFHLIGCNLVGKQRIRFIEEQMRLCREEYAKLKNEIAAIDRKKKKLKRNSPEKPLSSNNNASTNNNNNNDETNSISASSSSTTANSSSSSSSKK